MVLGILQLLSSFLVLSGWAVPLNRLQKGHVVLFMTNESFNFALLKKIDKERKPKRMFSKMSASTIVTCHF